MGFLRTLLRNVLFLALVALGVVGGWFIFLGYPESLTELLGVVFVLLLVPIVAKLAQNIASTVFAPYNVAEISVKGPITRENKPGPVGATPIGASANQIVNRIERADEDGNVDALMMRLNTPGGEIVPSEDIKLAIERFDGPTVAYATDTCASGGYEIASGCDELWARDGSIIGSIGVIGSRVTAEGLADKLGLEYQQLTAGEYKDAGMPLKRLDEDEREYLQGIVDGYYDMFVENVAERREVDPQELRDTEARVYLGRDAAEIGLVDEIGTREAVIDRLEERIEKSLEIKSFDPQRGLAGRLNAGAQHVAYAAGAGLVDTLREDRSTTFEY